MRPFLAARAVTRSSAYCGTRQRLQTPSRFGVILCGAFLAGGGDPNMRMGKIENLGARLIAGTDQADRLTNWGPRASGPFSHVKHHVFCDLALYVTE